MSTTTSDNKKRNNSKSVCKNFRFERELLDQINQAKDPLIPLAAWVKQACREKLERDGVQLEPCSYNEVNVDTNALSDIQQKVLELRNSKIDGHNMPLHDVAEAMAEQGYKTAKGNRFTVAAVRHVLSQINK